jgi:hypothetical protein
VAPVKAPAAGESVSVAAGLTVREYTCPIDELLSITLTVKLTVPATVGVPLNVPLGDSVSPEGRLFAE